MIYLKGGQPSCHQKCQKIPEHAFIGLPSGCLKAEASLTQSEVGSWDAGKGKSENRNHIQTLSLVKSICVLIHMKLGNHCLNFCSGFTVITHLDNKSAMGLFLPGTWITMISILKCSLKSYISGTSGQERVFGFASI